MLRHALHQTSLSRLIRRSPLIRSVAARWWHRQQAHSFRSVMRNLRSPVTPLDADSPINAPKIAPLTSPEAVQVGQEFANSMRAVCSANKFYEFGYQNFYGAALKHLSDRPISILEIGIGVNDPLAPSGMGSTYKIGSSLVGWSHYFPEASVHGADIDPRCLIDSHLFQTHLVDQRDPTSLLELANSFSSDLHLVVDDGLHTPEANALVAQAFLPRLAMDGVLVIEDILPEWNYLWVELDQYLSSDYSVTFYPAGDPSTRLVGGLAAFRRQ